MIGDDPAQPELVAALERIPHRVRVGHRSVRPLHDGGVLGQRDERQRPDLLQELASWVDVAGDREVVGTEDLDDRVEIAEGAWPRGVPARKVHPADPTAR